MHVITVTPASRLLLDSQVVVTDDVFDQPRLRLRLGTHSERGVILDLDPEALALLANTLRNMLAGYRTAIRHLDDPARRFRA